MSGAAAELECMGVDMVTGQAVGGAACFDVFSFNRPLIRDQGHPIDVMP